MVKQEIYEVESRGTSYSIGGVKVAVKLTEYL